MPDIMNVILNPCTGMMHGLSHAHKKIHNLYNPTQKALAHAGAFVISYAGCGMIALIREVAVFAKT